IAYDEIDFIEGLDDYVKIHLENGKRITARISMKSILEKLPDQLFVRVHRSYIVSIKKVKSIQNKVLYLKDEEIPIGETYKNVILEFFKV
ncbi:MAG TPA: DNA-binding response regulator, partial [Flavobacteriaceae bacterium]|nr:DNA-binding response regulator [Flavobacteriaceae bacterium]